MGESAAEIGFASPISVGDGLRVDLGEEIGEIGLLVGLAIPGGRLDVGEADEFEHLPHAIVDSNHQGRHAGLHADDAAVEPAAEAEFARGDPATPLIGVEKHHEFVLSLPFFGMLVRRRSGDPATGPVVDMGIVVARQGQIVGNHLVLHDIACDARRLQQRMGVDDRIGHAAEIAAEGDLLRLRQVGVGEGCERALHPAGEK